MVKKHEGNGMWSSSRMMLPEHVNEIREEKKRLNDFKKLVLDDQELEVVHNAIGQSLISKCLITLKVYDISKYRMIKGIVTRVDHKLKQVKFILHNPFEEGEPEWE